MKEAGKPNSTEAQVTLISVFIQHNLGDLQLQMKAVLHLLLARPKKSGCMSTPNDNNREFGDFHVDGKNGN